MSDRPQDGAEEVSGKDSGEVGTTLSVEEFTQKYDDWAGDYDEENDSDVIRACTSLVIDHADPAPDDIVLDMGTGTGAIALALADEAERVVGRDISGEMLNRARSKASDRGIDDVEFGIGRLRDPNVSGADVVVTNLVLHHLNDDAKRDAIETLAGLGPRRLVFGEAMYFGDRDPKDPLFEPETVYPATVGFLVDAITDAGYAVTAVERVHDEAGVLVAERLRED